MRGGGCVGGMGWDGMGWRVAICFLYLVLDERL
jgi:hypothetical protein